MNTKFDCDIVNGLSNAVCGRIDLLEKILGLKVRENLRYSDIQKIVKSGFAEEFFDIGDEIMTTYTATDGTEYDFPWLVVDFRDVYLENDPNPHPGMVLQAKYATAEGIEYDAPEYTVVNSETEQTAQEGWYYFGKNGNVYTALNLNVGDELPFNDHASIHKCAFNNTKIMYNGYCNYEMSAVRQWLNSEAVAGQWWRPTHLGDNAPNQSGTLNGFIFGLPSDFVEMLSFTKIRYLFNGQVVTMYDRMFLPSVEEMYGVSERDVNGIEGPYFQYWKEKTGLNFPDNSNNIGRIITSLAGDVPLPYCWLRTSGSSYTDTQLAFSNNDGSMMGGINMLSIQIYTLPCCVIS